MRYTAEYFAYKHFSHFIAPGTQMIGYAGRDYNRTPIVVFRTTEGGYIVTAGNFTDQPHKANVKIGKKYLNLHTTPHSFNTFVVK
jgi:glucosylceramidase